MTGIVLPTLNLESGFDSIHVPFQHDIHQNQIPDACHPLRIASSPTSLAGTRYPSRCRLS